MGDTYFTIPQKGCRKYFVPAALILSTVAIRSNSLNYGVSFCLLMLRILVSLMCWLSLEEISELVVKCCCCCCCRLYVMLEICRSGALTLGSSRQSSQLAHRSRLCYILFVKSSDALSAGFANCLPVSVRWLIEMPCLTRQLVMFCGSKNVAIFDWG